MGNKENFTKKTQEEIENNLIELNSITKDDLFINKTNLEISFEFNSNIFAKITQNVVKAQVYTHINGIRTFHKEVKLNFSQTYDFFNCLRTSSYLFFEKKAKNVNKITNTCSGDDDEDNMLCPICNKNNIDTNLPCTHFFCFSCIEKWVLDKNNSCPICRTIVEVDMEGTGAKFPKEDIVVIDKDNLKEVNENNETRLTDLLNDLFR